MASHLRIFLGLSVCALLTACGGATGIRVKDTTRSFTTVVVDAGHGGKDNGAFRRYGGAEKNATLDYWESGMDLGLSRDMFESFLAYQGLIQRAFGRMQKRYGFTIVDANRDFPRIQRELRAHLTTSLGTGAK